MIMSIDMFRGQMKSESHPLLTTSAGREYHAAYRCDFMGIGVIVPVEFLVDHFIDAGRGHRISGHEYFTRICHVDLLTFSVLLEPQSFSSRKIDLCALAT